MFQSLFCQCSIKFGYLQAFDTLKEAARLSDAVLHDVQSANTLSEVREQQCRAPKFFKQEKVHASSSQLMIVGY